VNGNKFLLDTNILLYLSGRKIDIDSLPEGRFLISFITELEILSYPSISAAEEKSLKEILLEMPIIDIDKDIKEQTIAFRKKYNLKLPDAIIAATAFVFGAVLITNDKAFGLVREIQVKSINLKDSVR
jgi:predicted nucleic acid-binding protein